MNENAQRVFCEYLKSWADYDGAEHELACALGILDHSIPFNTTAKHIFWSRNELGDALFDILQILTRIGALKYDEENLRYRWNSEFNWQDSSHRGGR